MSTIIWTISDEAGFRSQLSVDVPDAATLADIQALADLLTPNVMDLSSGAVDEVSVKLALTVAGVPETVAAVDSVIQNKALFVFRDAAGFVKRMTIPAVNMAQVNPDRTLSQGVGTPATDFKDNVIAGSGTATPESIHGDDLTSLLAARFYSAKDRGIAG
jgi:hypothetical protein